jgi:hypothetical protein
MDRIELPFRERETERGLCEFALMLNIRYVIALEAGDVGLLKTIQHKSRQEMMSIECRSSSEMKRFCPQT